MATPVLTSAEVERYSRQMLLPSLGPLAQKKILSGSVLVVGAGGLGCPVILYLAGTGFISAVFSYSAII